MRHLSSLLRQVWQKDLHYWSLRIAAFLFAGNDILQGCFCLLLNDNSSWSFLTSQGNDRIHSHDGMGSWIRVLDQWTSLLLRWFYVCFVPYNVGLRYKEHHSLPLHCIDNQRLSFGSIFTILFP